MAKKYVLLDAHQAFVPATRAVVMISKNEAMIMLRRGQADPVGPRLIRRRAAETLVQKPEWSPHDKTPIPAGRLELFVGGKRVKILEPDGGLAPREIPGVYFQPPQSLTWREQHRRVQF